ncbi:MAG: hypothetical protein ACLRFI_00645 [Alphaproteobacteria bacterium]
MKTKYVLLTALSALLVGAGANAATDLRVATQAYTDSHLASKDIATPTAEATGKVVTYNGTKFDYTDKGAVMPDGTADGQMLKWDADNSKWVAETGLSAGEAIKIENDGTINVKYDGTAVQKNGSDQLTVPTFTGASYYDSGADAHNGEPGLVPKAMAKQDYEKFLKGDGTWAIPNNTQYDGINGVKTPVLNTTTGKYEFDVKAVANGGITVTADGVSVNVDNETITVGTDGKLKAAQVDISGKLDKNNAIEASGDEFNVVQYDAKGLVVQGAKAYTADEVDSNIADVTAVMGERADSANYYDKTNTLAEADKLLDAQIKLNADAIATKATAATTLAGYGITDAYTTTETDAALDAKADKATSLAGYGITDAYTKSETDDLLDDKLNANTAITASGEKNMVVQYDENGLVLKGTEAYTADEVDDKFEALATTYDAYGAASAVQGSTTTTVAGLESNVGDITTLTTNTTSSTVAAINELKTAADGKITKPTNNCTTGHMCALVQSVDASGNATESWVDLTNPYTL